jgi:hypothetical protein
MKLTLTCLVGLAMLAAHSTVIMVVGQMVAHLGRVIQ